MKVLRWLLQCDRDEQLRAEQFHHQTRLPGSGGSPWVLSSSRIDELTLPAQRIEWLHSYLEDTGDPRRSSQSRLPNCWLIDAFGPETVYRLAALQALSIWREVHHLGITAHSLESWWASG